MKIRFTILFLLMAYSAFSQVDSAQTKKVTVSGYADIYYGYDFNKPQTHERPAFLYNHNRHNEFNVNLAFLKAAYISDNVRGNLALMAGTYAQYNLAAEQALLRTVLEANAGLRLAPNLWVDAGIFGSHIGLESAVSKDNLTLTRSLAAENSPYYESGVKVTYQAGSQWTLTGLVLNGWQNIREPENNSNKAMGTQIQFKPTENLLLNSSTFIGNEKPDNARQMRYFHDFYLTYQLPGALKMAVVFDVGAEKKLNTDDYSWWYTPAILLNYAMTDKVALAGRAEYYQDKAGVIISTNPGAGFQTYGYSLGLDYAPASNFLIRAEGRLLDSRDAIFTRENQAVDKSMGLTTSVAISFN